jgi:ABC-type transporter Mla subunit MlaD
MMNATFVPPTRFSRLVLKVNAFLLIALLLGAAFIGLVAYKQGWFVHQTHVHFVTANALGLNKGMPVKLYGFTVGSIAGMELSEEGVDVRLSIMSEYMHRIPKGSLAKHSREAGVVGAAVIDIVPGKPGAALAEGERIDFQPSRSIAEYIDDIRRQAVPAFNE